MTERSEGTPRTGVLDTDTVILLERLARGDLPDEPFITAVTLAELSVGPLVAGDEVEAARRQARLQRVEASFQALPFDAAAAAAFGHVAASLRRRGRKITARGFDAMIAATAMANGMALHTGNARDFEGIAGLDVVAVAPPDA